jgi:hypothetical protein
MSQTTISADLIGTVPAPTVRTGWLRQFAMLIAAAAAGAALALAGNAGVAVYQAGVAAEQAASVSAAQVALQRIEFLRSERAEALPATVSLDSVPAFLRSERAEALPATVSLDSVPAFLRSERDEAPPSH